VSEDLQQALSLDGLRSSHPIEVPVGKAEEINQIFDSISYSKGSCIIHMISSYLGEDVFLEGVRQYLKRHKYGNTETGDLWKALSETSGKDVGAVMDIWTKNIGYPVVSVTEKDDGIHLEQHRFLTTGDVKPEDDKVLYPISLNLRSKDGVDSSLMLDTREKVLALKDLDFFQLNANYSGFFRTHYSAARLAKLGKAAGALSVQDRVGIVGDAGALATSGYQKTTDLLELFKALSDGGESEFLVWDQILNRLGSIRMAWIEHPDVTEKLLDFQRTIFSPLAHKLGWEFSEKDGHVEQQFKALTFAAAGSAGDEKIIAAAKDMFKAYVAGDHSAMHPNIRGSVFSMNLRYGGADEVNQAVTSPFYLRCANIIFSTRRS